MPKPRKRKCLHCHDFFRPDQRNVKTQKYCSQPECRKASKAASQRRWLAKEENQNYFRGADNVARVQQWRQDHPKYWQRSKPLQDHSISELTEHQDVTMRFTGNALQDLLSDYHTVFLGLLAQLSGSALQDEIVATGRRMQQLGQDILSPANCKTGGRYDNQQASPYSAHGPPGT